jgi:hypothetical protein
MFIYPYRGDGLPTDILVIPGRSRTWCNRSLGRLSHCLTPKISCATTNRLIRDVDIVVVLGGELRALTNSSRSSTRVLIEREVGGISRSVGPWPVMGSVFPKLV